MEYDQKCNKQKGLSPLLLHVSAKIVKYFTIQDVIIKKAQAIIAYLVPNVIIFEAFLNVFFE